MAWNGSGSGGSAAPQAPKQMGERASSSLKGILAGAVVVIGAVAALYLLTVKGKGENPVEKVAKKSTAISEVRPASAPVSKAEPKAKKSVDPREDYDHTEMYRDPQGILRYNSGARAPDPTRPRKKPVMLGTNARKVFAFPSENLIAGILSAVPGERRFFTPDYYDECFTEDFKASLKEPIVINDDDPPWDKDIKKAMLEVREELKKRMDAGEKLGDILTETSKELERLGEYKEQLKAQMDKVIEEGDGELSEADIKDLVGAANTMLESNGADPVEVDDFVIWNMRLNAAKKGKTAEETEAEIDEYNQKRLEEIEGQGEKQENIGGK